jgi:hypothetical protein
VEPNNSILDIPMQKQITAFHVWVVGDKRWSVYISSKFSLPDDIFSTFSALNSIPHMSFKFSNSYLLLRFRVDTYTTHLMFTPIHCKVKELSFWVVTQKTTSHRGHYAGGCLLPGDRIASGLGGAVGRCQWGAGIQFKLRLLGVRQM